MANVGVVVLSLLSAAFEWFKEGLFGRLRRAVEPSSGSSSGEGEFDFDAEVRWSRFEQIWDLACLLLLLLPGWLSTSSSWRHVLHLSLPRIRSRVTGLLRFYLALESGFRLASTARSLRAKSWLAAASHASILLALLLVNDWTLQPARFIASFLLLRQMTAVWQALFTVFSMDNLINRRYFSLVLNGAQIVLLLGGAIRERQTLLASPVLIAMILPYALQLARALQGFL